MADDLLATPLGKLPPPVVMNKSESGGPISAPNYNDLRDSIAIPTADENRFQQLQPQQSYQPQQQQFYEPPQQQYYDHPPMQYEQHQPVAQHYAPSIPPSTFKKKKKRAPFFSTDTLKDKKLWLFAAIVFLLYTYGLPKLRTTFPSFVDPTTNALKSPAVMTASLASGLFYMFTSEFI